jgi:hypothetical protein
LGRIERWHLFANDEIFFNLSAGNWNQNRFTAGGGARINGRLALDVYYLQKVPRGTAPTVNVLGTSFKVRLTPARERSSQ